MLLLLSSSYRKLFIITSVTKYINSTSYNTTTISALAGDAGQGEPSTAADVTFSLGKDNFVAMFTGKLKPTTAFMQGALKIKGDMLKAMKLESIMNKTKL